MWRISAMKECSVYKSPKSAVRDRGALNHLLPVFGTIVLTGITPKWLAGLQDTTSTGAGSGDGQQGTSARAACFQPAVHEWEWGQENPMHRVSMEKTHNEVDRWLTLEEEDRLMAALSPWLREFIVFALNTGMPPGEILSLQWQDVDFTRGKFVTRLGRKATESKERHRTNRTVKALDHTN
jgi:integrase